MSRSVISTSTTPCLSSCRAGGPYTSWMEGMILGWLSASSRMAGTRMWWITVAKAAMRTGPASRSVKRVSSRLASASSSSTRSA